jgi:hypothetical protein
MFCRSTDPAATALSCRMLQTAAAGHTSCCFCIKQHTYIGDKFVHSVCYEVGSNICRASVYFQAKLLSAWFLITIFLVATSLKRYLRESSDNFHNNFILS